jgi:hypothetical protein
MLKNECWKVEGRFYMLKLEIEYIFQNSILKVLLGSQSLLILLTVIGCNYFILAHRKRILVKVKTT